jgi:hypothetical protein
MNPNPLLQPTALISLGNALGVVVPLFLLALPLLALLRLPLLNLLRLLPLQQYLSRLKSTVLWPAASRDRTFFSF